MFGKKLKEIASAVFGARDWVKELAPEMPAEADQTTAVTHVYAGANAKGPCAEWLELRRNDTVQTSTMVASGKPAFFFYDTNQEVCRDGEKFGIGNLTFVKAPADLDKEKYTLFRRQAQPNKPGLAYAFFLTSVKYNRVFYKTEIAEKNIGLQEGLAAMARYEQDCSWAEPADTISAKKYFSKIESSAPRPSAPVAS